MGKNLGPEVEYNCFNDCDITGCPGHKIRAVSCRSSDVYSFEIDGKAEYHFDENVFNAILKAHESFKAYWKAKNEKVAAPEPVAEPQVLITREQLKGIEFDPDTDTCHVCGEYRNHFTDCWLGKALAGRG